MHFDGTYRLSRADNSLPFPTLPNYLPQSYNYQGVLHAEASHQFSPNSTRPSRQLGKATTLRLSLPLQTATTTPSKSTTARCPGRPCPSSLTSKRRFPQSSACAESRCSLCSGLTARSRTETAELLSHKQAITWPRLLPSGRKVDNKTEE